MMLSGESHRRIDRLRSTADEERTRQTLGEPAIEQSLDEANAAPGRERRNDEGRLLDTERIRLRHFPAAVADVDDDRTAGRIEDRGAVGREEVDAFRALDLERLLEDLAGEGRYGEPSEAFGGSNLSFQRSATARLSEFMAPLSCRDSLWFLLEPAL